MIFIGYVLVQIKKKGQVEPPLYPTIEGQVGGKWLVVDCGEMIYWCGLFGWVKELNVSRLTFLLYVGFDRKYYHSHPR